jgi:excisionase family DNA binding protein
VDSTTPASDVGLDEKLVGVKEVAAYLDVHDSWVWRAAREGRLPHVPIGRYRKFRLSEIRNWVEERAASEPSPPWNDRGAA